MTEVEFHTGVVDSLSFACRLLRKAARRGARVLVTAPTSVLAELDNALWTFDEHDFVPHVRLPSTSTAVLQRTPIWLAVDTLSVHHAAQNFQADAAPRVVVNLGADAPEDLHAIDRLIEVVALDADEADAGRARWRTYRAQGLQIVHHQGSDTRA